MPIVRVPDGRLVNFPDDMPNQEIKSIIQKKFPNAFLTPLSEEQKAKPKENPQEWVNHPLVRGGASLLQGIANAGFNPAGYVAKSAGIDIEPLSNEEMTPTERALAKGGQYGFDAAALATTGGLAKGAGYLGSGAGAISKVAQSILAPNILNAAAMGSAGGVSEGLTNPKTEAGKMLANLAGSMIAGAGTGYLYRTKRQLAGGLKNVLSDIEANKALARGIKDSEVVADEVIKQAQPAKEQLNSRLEKILNDTTGRKINIEQAKENAKSVYKDFIEKNANRQVLDMNNPKESLGKFTQGLNEYQKEELSNVLAMGKRLTNTQVGSLEHINNAKSLLNDKISTLLQNNERKFAQELSPIKKHLDDLLLESGTKKVDAQYSKAMKLQEAFDEGYKFNKPSDFKFNKLGLKSNINKKAFLQGRMQSILDNVTDEKTIAEKIIEDQNTLKKLMPENSFNKLMNSAERTSKEFKRLNALESAANKKILAPTKAGRQLSETAETRSSFIGNAIDKLRGVIYGGINEREALKYLNPENTNITTRGGLKGAGKEMTNSGLRQILSIIAQKKEND